MRRGAELLSGVSGASIAEPLSALFNTRDMGARRTDEEGSGPGGSLTAGLSRGRSLNRSLDHFRRPSILRTILGDAP